jgi:hypothetical protein
VQECARETNRYAAVTQVYSYYEMMRSCHNQRMASLWGCDQDDDNGGGGGEMTGGSSSLLPPWSHAAIYVHITQHLLNPMIILHDDLRSLQEIKAGFLQRIERVDVRAMAGEEDTSIDAESWRCYNQALDRTERYLKLWNMFAGGAGGGGGAMAGGSGPSVGKQPFISPANAHVSRYRPPPGPRRGPRRGSNGSMSLSSSSLSSCGGGGGGMRGRRRGNKRTHGGDSLLGSNGRGQKRQRGLGGCEPPQAIS